MGQFLCKTVTLLFAISLIASASARPQDPTDAIIPEVPQGSEQTLARAATPGSLVQNTSCFKRTEPDTDILSPTYGLLEISEDSTCIPAEAYRMNRHIKAVIIPPSVTLIDVEAFYQCSNMASVTFTGTSSLKTIGLRAFAYTGLTTFDIPPTVTLIERHAFTRTRSMATVTFTGTSSLQTIGESIFSHSGLIAIEIPPSVTSIANSAFSECWDLVSVTFSGTSSLQTIGERAFYKTFYFVDITTRASINFPTSVTRIGNSAFLEAPYLYYITFTSDSKLESIGKSSFSGTALGLLTSVSIPSMATYCEDGTRNPDEPWVCGATSEDDSFPSGCTVDTFVSTSTRVPTASPTPLPSCVAVPGNSWGMTDRDCSPCQWHPVDPWCYQPDICHGECTEWRE